MNSEERIKELHKRMAKRHRNKIERQTFMYGASSTILCICLILAILTDGNHAGTIAVTYSGASMLFDNAGGYVLTALAAFLLGVIITLIIRRYHSKSNASQDNE